MELFSFHGCSGLPGGRNFNTGTAEVIVGKGAYDQYAGVEIGDQIKVRDGFVTVVGIFSTEGDVHESEIWGDLPITQNIFRREGSVSSAIVRLESKDTFDDLGIYILMTYSGKTSK